jgi:glutamate/tyrosine decarboxylase-like PLP-dependent enzyme
MKNPRISFPEKGLDASTLIPEMQMIKSSDASWRNGKMFGYIYYPGDEAARVVEEAFQMFSSENALNPSLFGSLKKFENETVQMVAGLLNAGQNAAGSLTSGGTESILMTVKTARDKARADHPGITSPVILIPESAHPAFQKAAHYLNVKVITTPVRSDKRADVDAMRKAITPDTVLLVGSAPCFPHGVIDPIADIGQVASEFKIPFHVDACLGGMMLPFAEKLGYPVPPFDFRVSGVTSISADIHKYGYSPKGASVIIYADHEFRKHQFYVYTDWSGGLYGSPTMLGTRCGGPIAAAWAAIMHLGYEGYLKKANDVMETSRKLQEGINTIPGLSVVSNPDLSVFAFTSATIDIFEVGDALSAQGWYLDRIQFPNGLHVTVSNNNVTQADNFLIAVRQAVETVTQNKLRSVSSHFVVSFVKGLSHILPEEWFRKLSSAASGLVGQKDNKKHGLNAAMYGITASIENRENVHDLVLNVLDKMY